MKLVGELTIPADHPALAGHFPGDPVVPGVLLLDHALALCVEAGLGRADSLRRVKFLRPVRPGDTLSVHAATGVAAGEWSVECRIADEPVVSALCASGPASPA